MRIAWAAGAALGGAAQGALPTATGRSFNMTTTGYVVWIPDGYVSRGNVADVLVLYHGDPTTVRNNLAYANLNSILVTVNLGAGSSSYQNPYAANISLFGNVLTEARTIVRNQADFDNALNWDKVAVASFSAGYGAVREILKQPSNYSTISNYAAMDTIYASFTSSSNHTPLASQMVDFKKLALDAKNGAKTMVLSHSEVQTFTYANTRETADDILAHLSLTSPPYTTPGLGNMPFNRHAASGNFTMYGANGSDANAHSIHLQQSGQFLAELSLNSKEVTLGNDATHSTDLAVPSALAYTGTTTGATISGQVQIPRRGGDHNFTIDNGSAASDLTITGRIWGVGTGLIKLGSGTMTLSGATANTFTGLTSANAGVLELNKNAGVTAVAGNVQARLGGTVKWLQSNQVADTATLTINGVPSIADLNGKSETLGAVQFFAGTLALGSGSLNVNGVINASSTMSTALITGSGVITGASLSASGNLTRSGGGVTKLTTSGLTIGPTRRLDLTDTKLITPATLSTITALITTGRNGGAWNGAGGIVTSMADAQDATARKTLGVATAGTIGKTSLAGVSVAPTDTLVTYTWSGDANLSGAVDADDFFYIDAGFTGQLTGWRNGDFNYSGKVDADDYWLIDRNYSRNLGSIYDVPPAGAAAVPEPAGLALLAAASTLLRRRRVELPPRRV